MLLSILSFCVPSFGQSIGQNGTAQYTSTPLHLVNSKGVAISPLKDTLTNTDTGALFIWVGNGYDEAFEFTLTTVTGTVTPVAIHLYGINNKGVPLTAAQVATDFQTLPVNAFEITGTVTNCAGCVGAGSTTVPGASKTYKYIIPKISGICGSFDNLFARIIVGGTATSVYSGFLTTVR